MTTVLITGGHSGIGLECSRRLAGRGVDLVLAGRSPGPMESLADELRAAHSVGVTVVELDLSSLASVRAAAAECRSLIDRGRVDTLDAVLCNAGGRFDGKVAHGPDGYEMTFTTNCLGHFLLVDLILPSMADRGRVVFTASGTHDPDTADGRLVGAAVEPDAVALAHQGRDGARPLSVGKRYSTSKLCTVMYAYELARRLDRSGSSITSIAYDPGSIPETGLLRGMPTAVRWFARTALMKRMSRLLGVTTSTLTFSGAALADLAVDSRYGTDSGRYFQAREGHLSVVRSSTMSYDERRASALWDASAELVGLAANTV